MIDLGNIDEYPWNANWLRLMALERSYLAGDMSREEFERRWNALASDERRQGPPPPTLEELREAERRGESE